MMMWSGGLGVTSRRALLFSLFAIFHFFVVSDNVTIALSSSSAVQFQFDDADVEVMSVAREGIESFCGTIADKMKGSMTANCEKMIQSIANYDTSISGENVFCLNNVDLESYFVLAENEATMLEQPDGDGIYARCFCNIQSKRAFTRFWSKLVASRSGTMTYKIVVSRYTEDLSWLDEGGEEVRINTLIYNKGEALGLPNEVLLPNIGRESHTYLNFIETHYDALPDVVVFSQGDVSDHSHVMGGKSPLNHLLSMKDHAAIFGKSKPFVTHYNGSTPTDDGDARSRPLNLFDSNFNHHPGFSMATVYNTGTASCTPITFGDWFMTFIAAEGDSYPNPINIYPNALFAVQRKLIRSRPVAFYNALAKEVGHDPNPVEGHFMERSWYYIFAR